MVDVGLMVEFGENAWTMSHESRTAIRAMVCRFINWVDNEGIPPVGDIGTGPIYSYNANDTDVH